jgi:hypothetical protein
LLDAVRREVGPDLRIIGEVGRALNGRVVLLARDVGRNLIVALRITALPGPAGYHEVEVVKELPEHMPNCMKCGSKVRPNAKFCTHCGSDSPLRKEPWSAEELREAAQDRARERGLDIRDEVRLQSGRIYFAASSETGKLQALQLDETPSGDYSLGAIGILDQLLAEATAPRAGA